ncbi:MAG: 3-keto-5-aminohexanoate cleavage protein [Bacteroidota bacterium]
MDPLIINFTPTGMIPTKNLTPHVAVSPDEIIEQVIAAYELGITMAHLHARDEEGAPTYKASVYRDIFEGIHQYCPDLLICASLSGRNFPELEKRTEVLQLKPDMGSLTLSSLNFSRAASVNSPDTIVGLIEAMDKYGAKPELECFDAGMINYAHYLIKKGVLRPPFYFNLLLGNVASTQAEIAHIGLMIRDLPDQSYWALASLGQTQLSINTLAIAFGGGVRVGVEDNIWYDSQRRKKATNLELLQRIHRLAAEFERPIMKSEELGQAGFYNTQRFTNLAK